MYTCQGVKPTIYKNRLSTDGCWHQFSASRNPKFGVGWRRKPDSVQTAPLWYSTTARNSSAVPQLSCVTAQLWSSTAVEQHGCELALGWGGPGARRLCCTSTCTCADLFYASLLFLVGFALLQWDFSVSALAGKRHSLSLVDRDSALFKPKQRGLLY